MFGKITCFAVSVTDVVYFALDAGSPPLIVLGTHVGTILRHHPSTA